MNCIIAKGLIRSVSLLPAFLFPWSGYAETMTPLPEPLTLQAALMFAENSDQYQIQSANEQLQQAIAQGEQTRADNDLRVNLSGRLRYVGVSELGDESEDNDSKASIYVRKSLYDFGKTTVYNSLADLKVELRQLEKAYLIEKRELSIVEKYFDVINADNEYLRHNEELAIGFIRFDRARDNQRLGLSSEMEVLERQVAYEKIRQNRYNSENLQRLTRILLAEELGVPQHPPSEVAVPELVSQSITTDDVDKMVEQAYRHSLRIRIQQKKLEIAKREIEAARHTIGPSIDAEVEFSEYARKGTTRDDRRASIYFDFPLYSGGMEKSAVTRATAKYRESLTELERTKSEIRIEVLKNWQAIRQNSLRLGGEIINQEYRDMILDKSRAEYELEFKTDLGNSMVQFSDSRMKAYQARFALEIAWRKLGKMLGKVYLEQIKTSGENSG